MNVYNLSAPLSGFTNAAAWFRRFRAVVGNLLFVCLLAVLPVRLRADKKPIEPDLAGHETILADWDLDGSGSWEISGGKLLLVKAGKPSGPIRRPSALAILKMKPVRDVTIEADIKSTAPLNVARRDLLLVFGYQSPGRFYYVHLAGTADAVHNGIFLVADADRRRIDDGKGSPPLKDQEWHHVRLVRAGARIEIYMDNSKTPLLSATDGTIPDGRIGFGSFDDTGEFRAIVVSGMADES